ncbi:2-C-methyl-D-erythritol 4-phosphate cytidylyltransferase [Nocardioides sp. TRM66260-LWL]|uniref:2-C-methyl-D-erythritol 4-phosphate cytidylyltransferase n=1 Tax=Nocardioides sp. TRM66260-LWL TaxID=2874478 RepID=UPI001CC5A39B|nr:2-C-methyl-D-erythritol 4-phosphate cytidylyltransferase [Nocardioides sp. TRM66260-LWL]MBZ5735001.1 2-C-methyl-D-erythritol 4-phosphate cytidylyltransferase [Nocardioides sp. TRM66260-LWL]
MDVVDLAEPDLDAEEQPPARGVVLDAGRGPLVFALVHGEPLVACAAWALGEAGVDLVDLGLGAEVLADLDEPVVLHDALCPLTPPPFLAACLREAQAQGVAVLGVRPVSDTVKQLDADAAGVVTLGETLDRDALLAVASPLALPAPVVAALAERGVALDGAADLATLARTIRDLGLPVRLAWAPPQGRRVHGEDDLRLLEALDPR